MTWAVQDPKTATDVWALRLNDRKAFPVLQSEFVATAARFSADGHWVAYLSNKSGANEVYVRPFDPDAADGSGSHAPGGEFLVSKGGSVGMPRWRSDGRELYWLTADGKVMVVDITTAPQFQAGEPRLLFQTPAGFIRPNAPGALADVKRAKRRPDFWLWCIRGRWVRRLFLQPVGDKQAEQK